MLVTFILAVSLLINPVSGPFSAEHDDLKEKDSLAVKSDIRVIKDLDANVRPYQYFSFSAGKAIPADAAKTSEWDIAFSKTTIIVNGGISGPGTGGAQVMEKRFDTIQEAPAEGYKTDSESGSAIPGGSGNSWYKYDMRVHAIIPLAERTILIRTAAGRFAKMEIINYYKGAPAEVPTEESGYFTFRYVLADENGKF